MADGTSFGINDKADVVSAYYNNDHNRLFSVEENSDPTLKKISNMDIIDNLAFSS